MEASGSTPRRAARKMMGELVEAVSRERKRGETLPWDVIEHGITKDYLWKEYQRGLEGRTTPPCDVGRCTRCGVC